MISIHKINLSQKICSISHSPNNFKKMNYSFDKFVAQNTLCLKLCE